MTKNAETENAKETQHKSNEKFLDIAVAIQHYSGGPKYYYVKGIEYTEKEYQFLLEKGELNESLNQTLEEKKTNTKVKI